MNSTNDCGTTADLKACMNFKWTDELTLQFVLYRHERRQLFTKKRNTSRHGWQQILRTMGLTEYVTPYQAQKKWNNLWSRYKLAKKAQDEGTLNDETNGGWPLYTVLDAIANGKNVSITSAGSGFRQEHESTAANNTISDPTQPSMETSSELSAVNREHLEPPTKKTKHAVESAVGQTQCWESESDSKQQIIELLQTNIHQLIEVKQAIETQGQAIIGMLSQLVSLVSSGAKILNGNTPPESNRIDEALSATIREIGIPHENV